MPAGWTGSVASVGWPPGVTGRHAVIGGSEEQHRGETTPGPPRRRRRSPCRRAGAGGGRGMGLLGAEQVGPARSPVCQRRAERDRRAGADSAAPRRQPLPSDHVRNLGGPAVEAWRHHGVSSATYFVVRIPMDARPHPSRPPRPRTFSAYPRSGASPSEHGQTTAPARTGRATRERRVPGETRTAKLRLSTSAVRDRLLAPSVARHALLRALIQRASHRLRFSARALCPRWAAVKVGHRMRNAPRRGIDYRSGGRPPRPCRARPGRTRLGTSP